MKIRLLGLGIFAIIFSLSLFFFGTSGLDQAPQETSFFESPSNQQHCLYDLGETNHLEGILQQNNEIHEQQHLVRKFPATLSLLFVLLHKTVVKSTVSLPVHDLSTFLSQDLHLAFHNLRI